MFPRLPARTLSTRFLAWLRGMLAFVATLQSPDLLSSSLLLLSFSEVRYDDADGSRSGAGCTCLKTEEVAMIAQHFPQLRRLNLSRCTMLDVGPLAALSQLEDVRLAGCVCVSDAGLAALLQGCSSSLTSLHLSGCLRCAASPLCCSPCPWSSFLSQCLMH